MQILIIRDTNGCHCRRYDKLIILKFQTAHALAKKSLGLDNFFRASKSCLLQMYLTFGLVMKKTSCKTMRA